MESIEKKTGLEKKIWLSSPHMSGREFEYVTEAFQTNWIAPVGPHIDRFEKEISNWASGLHVAALSSGTAAIHLALILSGVRPGDLVICQSLTFSASANPISYLGAIPVFVDSEKDTWNMCPRELENAVKACLNGKLKDQQGIPIKSKKPKAIIPVHLYGMPAKMCEINEIASKYGIPVIEDAAEALGSHLDDKACGTWGEFGVYSFNGNKIITTSGGGALISRNEKEIQEAKFLATQARENAPHYEHKKTGYNYRLSNVSAAIGIGQMEILGERVKQRRKNFEFYRESLSGIPGISFLPEPKGFYSNRWLTTILVDPERTERGVNREKIRLTLEQYNVESRPIWKPMHLQPVFARLPFFGEELISEQIFERGLCLPSGSNLTLNELSEVIKIISSL